MRDNIRALSSEFLARGFAGKHCAVIGKFSYSYVRVYFSLLAIGAVMVPLDRDWLKEDLTETAARADAEVLIIDGDLAEKAEARQNRIDQIIAEDIPELYELTMKDVTDYLESNKIKSLNEDFE